MFTKTALEDFDARPTRGPAAPTPDIEREELRAAAYAAGRADGEFAAGEAARDAARLDVAETLTAAFSRADARLEADFSAFAEALTGLVVTALRAFVPQALVRHECAEIDAFLRTVSAGVLPPGPLTLSLRADAPPALLAVLETLPPALRARIAVDTDGALLPGEASLAWAFGSVTRHFAALRDRFDSVLRVHGLVPEDVPSPHDIRTSA